jgi:hypothetical protein
MKTLCLSNVLKAIKFTVTRDGRMAAGKFNYYEDANQDAVLSNPTSHFMLNGSLSLPSVAYTSDEGVGSGNTVLTLTNGHFAVYVQSGSNITEITLPAPTADVLHRTYVLVNQKSSTVPVRFTTGGNTTTAITLSALPATSASITTVANLPINSVLIQCQRTSRAYSATPTYTWRIISANYAPSVGASQAATSYYGGIFKVNLVRTTGVSISASTLSAYITITSNGGSGIPQSGNSNQITRSFGTGVQSVNVSVSSSLPSGYSFSYWQLKSPTVGSANSSQPFTQVLDGSSTPSNTNTTEIDLVFSYSAPITSSTYSYSAASGGSYSSISGCPTPNMLIAISEHAWIKAGLLNVGDYVYTKHELTGEYGNYQVTHTERSIQPVLLVTVGNKTVEVSESHKFLTADGKYISISDLELGELIQTVDGDLPLISKEFIGNMEIVKLEIDQAHTYIVEGIHSHNKFSGGGGGVS